MDLSVERLELADGMRVLDLGCGTGNALTRVLAVTGVTAVGVDATSDMLDRAKRKLCDELKSGRLQLVQDDVIGFLKSQPDNSFDRVVTINVLYIIRDQDQLWSELLRVLRPEGLIVATTSVERKNLPIIREHVQNASALRLLRPSLLAVFFIDCLIGLLGLQKAFPFHSEAALRSAAERAGGRWIASERCYGGPEHGVNRLFTVRKRST
jgi:ubiquinone/menaquinone biosynthesis C-methylase UbiE